MKTWGKWLTWLGLAIAIICVVVGTIMAVAGFSKLADVVNESFRVSGPTQYTATAGETLVLYYDGPDGTATTPSCQIVGPAQPTPGSVVDGEFTYNSETISPFLAWRFTESGSYTITCDQTGVVAGPQLPIGGILSGAGGVLLAVFGGGLGFLMLIIGIILWVVGANKTKTPPPVGAWQQPYPPQAYPSQPGQPYPSQPGPVYPQQPGPAQPGQPYPPAPGAGSPPAAPPSSSPAPGSPDDHPPTPPPAGH